MGGFIQPWLRSDVLEAVQKLRPLSDEAGCTLSQFALAWTLREPNVASAIVGASRAAQLNENAAAAELEIDPTLFHKAEAIIGALRRR
jgi:aryl-alcohol dehydrogenase-like predicted oxidoreductase